MGYRPVMWAQDTVGRVESQESDLKTYELTIRCGTCARPGTEGRTIAVFGVHDDPLTGREVNRTIGLRSKRSETAVRKDVAAAMRFERREQEALLVESGDTPVARWYLKHQRMTGRAIELKCSACGTVHRLRSADLARDAREHKDSITVRRTSGSR